MLTENQQKRWVQVSDKELIDNSRELQIAGLAEASLIVLVLLQEHLRTDVERRQVRCIESHIIVAHPMALMRYHRMSSEKDIVAYRQTMSSAIARVTYSTC